MFKNLLKEYQEGYVYLFSDRSFYKKLWIIPLLLFFPFIKYPFGIIFIKGWQVQMVEDIMLDKPLQSLQIKKIVLKILAPFNFCVRSSARPNASTLISKIDTIANNTVNLNELVNDVSLIAAV